MDNKVNLEGEIGHPIRELHAILGDHYEFALN